MTAAIFLALWRISKPWHSEVATWYYTSRKSCLWERSSARLFVLPDLWPRGPVRERSNWLVHNLSPASHHTTCGPAKMRQFIIILKIAIFLMAWGHASWLMSVLVVCLSAEINITSVESLGPSTNNESPFNKRFAWSQPIFPRWGGKIDRSRCNHFQIGFLYIRDLLQYPQWYFKFMRRFLNPWY